jgi:hypothetical protein
VGQNTVVGEDVDNEELGKLSRGDSVVCRNKDRLLHKAINNDKNGIISGGLRELFDEIHGDQIPWLFQSWKLLQEALWLVTLWL